MVAVSKNVRLRLQKTGLALALYAPLAIIAFQFLTNGLGANPVEAATHNTGLWALRILLLTLAITPLRILFLWRRPLLFRRMLGLASFAYAAVHFMIYLIFDQDLEFSSTFDDVVKRPYITIGFAALVLMVPLALTSNSYMLKKLGARKWRTLHKLAYVIAILVVVHFVWSVKADITEPLVYGVILALLVGVRVYEKLKVKIKTIAFVQK